MMRPAARHKLPSPIAEFDLVRGVGHSISYSIAFESTAHKLALFSAGVNTGAPAFESVNPGAAFAARRTSDGCCQRMTVAKITAIDWVSSIVGGTT